ncbi:MAG: FAD-dependent oxidoreductase [Alphaproteobacteria bacterium]|nr:FAD-dependent oxidoreductase [Alphaproteobacteria bacterium]
MQGSGVQHGPKLDYVPPPELTQGDGAKRPVVVVGAGPVGLAAAVDLAQREVPVVLVDDNDQVSTGSRAICWAKRTLEVMDGLGVADRMVAKGVTWSEGKVFHGDELLYSFDLLPEEGHKMPAFINLQQYYVEDYLIHRARKLPNLEMRWNNKLVGLTRGSDSVELEIETPDGRYRLVADYVVACDGANSPIRRMLGLDFEGKVFEDRFLIADVKMTASYPNERRFWFDPTFHAGQSALLHRQPDDVFRIDLQLGWDADPEEEKKPETVIPRIKAIVGEDTSFELEWVSIYTFQCRRLGKFRHGRVIFAGDSAHVVSPFGARGGNGGIQDVDNLGWKLAAVLSGNAPERLLDTYDEERVFAADENLRNSSRSTDFMTPKSPASEVFRDAVLQLARDHEFARKLVNSGRLSLPAKLAGMSTMTPDAEGFAGGLGPGSPCEDAPVTNPDGTDGWLLRHVGGGDFTVLAFGELAPVAQIAEMSGVPVVWIGSGTTPLGVTKLGDPQGLAAKRYGAAHGAVYLIRPDQHVVARWRACTAADVIHARDRALARDTAEPAMAGTGD